MDAKEKLRLMNAIAEKLKGEVVVIDHEGETETLSLDIINRIAEKTAESFEEMADGMEMATLKQLVSRLVSADMESVVPMLQSMFLAIGMADAADELDMLELCFRYDEETYFIFYDILFDTDIFDWFSIECLFDDFRSEGESKSD